VLKESNPESEPQAFADFISMLHSKAGPSRSRVPKSRTLTSFEHASLIVALQDAGKQPADKWAARADWLHIPLPEAKTSTYNQYRHASQIYATAAVQGKEFGDIAKQANADDSGAGKQLMENGDHLTKLGIISAIDFFLSITDRLDAGNVGNWFVDIGKVMTKISLIDNFTPTNYQTLTEPHKDEYLLDKLSTNNLPQTAQDLVGGLVGGTTKFYKAAARGGIDWGAWWTQERKDFALFFLHRGLTQGRDRLLRLILGGRGFFRRKKPSESLRKSVGDEAWAVVQQRATYVKNLG
jgi:hypothetical protein